MSIINIAIFTIVSIFVLLLFTSKPPKGGVSQTLPFLGSNPFFGAQIDDDEKLMDDNEKNFNKEYEDKNKNILTLQKELNLCITNRTNLNNAIQKFRDELITTVNTNSSNLQKEISDCDTTRDLRIQKYITAYNKRFNTSINKQQVINKIATKTLTSK